MDQVGEGVRAVVVPVTVVEVPFVRRESETRGEGEAVVGEVEPVSVGQDVPEVDVEVRELVLVKEAGDGFEAPLHEGAGGVGVVGAQLGGEPVVERVRQVFHEQGQARGRRAQRLDVLAAAAPVRHVPLHVGEFLGQ